VYPDEPDTNGHSDDGAQDTEQQEQKNTLGGLDLEQQQKVIVES